MPFLRTAAPWLLIFLLPVFLLLALMAGTRGVLAAPVARERATALVDPSTIAIDITKTVGTTGPCPSTRAVTVNAGTTVYYCFKMRNTGTETVDTHNLVDSHFGFLLDAFSRTVAPGNSMVVTLTRAASVSVTNIATWTAWQVGGPATLDSDVSSATLTVIVPQPPPSIVLTKTIGLNPSVCAATKSLTVIQGTQVVFCFKIRNTGTQTLLLHKLTDAALGSVLTNLSRAVAPGATTFVTKSTTANVTSSAVATWTAYVTNTTGTFAKDTDSATLNVTPRTLALQFTKTVGKSNSCATTTTLTVSPGERVVYCYKVKNNSNVTLGLHKLIDNKLGTIVNNSTASFVPGQTLVFTRSATAAITTTNTATWTSWLTNTLSPKVVKVASATVRTPHLPNLTFAKTVGTNPHVCSTLESVTVIQGFPAVYCYKATNTGNVPLRLHTLEDAQFGALITNQPFTLSVGSSVIITKEFTADITHTTVATWTAWETTVTSPRVRKTDSATLKVIMNPAKITLVKTVGVSTDYCPLTTKIEVPSGTTVHYCYAVQNTGTLTLPKHQLYDDDLQYDILPADFLYDLKPGEVVSTRDLGISVSRQITKTTVNFAIWESYINDVLYAQATAMATVTVRTAQTDLLLTVGPALCDDDQFFEGDEGASFSLCLRITNMGDITLTHHAISVPALGIDTAVDQPLEPGKSLTLTRDILSVLGPRSLSSSNSGQIEAVVTSSSNPFGAPFVAVKQSTVTLLITADTRRLYLPTAQN